jgi:hypothetical protein
MSRLDDELREALRREDPGPDFTARVLARAAAQPRRVSWWSALAAGFRPPRWAAAGVAFGVLVAAGGLEYRREAQTRVEGEAAKRQLVLALRIAGSKLHNAQTKVMRSGE